MNKNKFVYNKFSTGYNYSTSKDVNHKTLRKVLFLQLIVYF